MLSIWYIDAFGAIHTAIMRAARPTRIRLRTVRLRNRHCTGITMQTTDRCQGT